MNPLEEFQSQKNDIESSKQELKIRYENLIKQKEEEIQHMKKFEDQYFQTKDMNRKLIEDIHAKTLELELMKNNEVLQDKEVIDKLTTRINQLQLEKQDLQDSLKHNHTETSLLQKDIRMINEQENSQQTKHQELLEALKKIENLEASLLRTQTLKEKDLIDKKHQIKSEKLLEIDTKLQ